MALSADQKAYLANILFYAKEDPQAAANELTNILNSLATTGGAITAADITDATTVGRSLVTAADATTARAAIGAGTSSLTLGTTNTTAKAGDYSPSTTEVGNALKTKAQISALATVSTADGSDATTTQALANALKVSVNAIIAALKA